MIAITYSDDRNSSGEFLNAWDGKTGEPLWQRRLTQVERSSPCSRLSVGPDVDGDGWREVFVAGGTRRWTIHGNSRGYNEDDPFVECYSGRDGRLLWWWQPPGGDKRPALDNNQVIGLSWGLPGPDDRPLLHVSFGFRDSPANRSIYLLCAGNGEQIGYMNVPWPGGGIHIDRVPRWPHLVDLKGDGQSELLVVDSPRGRGILLVALLTPHPAVWKRIGTTAVVGPDLNGDDFPDLLTENGAVSGRDGRLLWARPDIHQARFLSEGADDLNGDGVPDLLQPPYSAISGRDGSLLWTGRVKNRSLSWWGGSLLTSARFTPGGPIDVIASYGSENHGVLARMDGRNGNLMWIHEFAVNATVDDSPAIADLNGDGTADLAIWLEKKLYAINGRDGTALWEGPTVNRLPQPWADSYSSSVNHAPLVADLDGDGRPEVIVNLTNGQTMGLAALSGAEGKRLWEWTGDAGEQIRMLSLPRLLRSGGIMRLCLAIAVANQHFFVQLDSHGKTISRRPILWDDKAIWTFDADGDASDELLLKSGGNVMLIRDDPDRPVWTWSPAGNFCRVRHVSASRNGRPAQVVVSDGSSLIGLDGLTGAESWRCPESEILIADDRYRRVLLQRGGLIRMYNYDANQPSPIVESINRPPARWRRPPPRDWVDQFSPLAYIVPTIVVVALIVLARKRRWWLMAFGTIIYVVIPLSILFYRIWQDWREKEPEEWFDWPRIYDIGPPYTVLAGKITIVLIPVVVSALVVWRVRRYLRQRRSLY